MVRSSAPWRRLVTLGLVLVVLLTACAPKLAQPDRLKKAEQLYATVLELYAGGRFAEAIPLAQEAHAIRKNVLGPRHPVTTTSLDILGVLCVETGAYAQARSLLEEALATSKAVLGLRHPDTATTLNNLGVLYVKTGAYAQAQPLLEEALATSKAV
ncbi:MAG TPA: tetratricopeptide repeat-containing protein, partial [Nitrospira sp.]|nr:tetratricopeptide repeat-containing protein [Nitrospira sp.]